MRLCAPIVDHNVLSTRNGRVKIVIRAECGVQVLGELPQIKNVMIDFSGDTRDTFSIKT